MEVIQSGKSFICIKNKNGPNSGPCGTTEFIFFKSEI